MKQNSKDVISSVARNLFNDSEKISHSGSAIIRNDKISIAKILFFIVLFSSFLFPQRIKDIATISGDNSEQVIGYGLVVGLAGTGDSYRTQFTMQSITSMLKIFRITVPQTHVKTRKVAAVKETAS